MATCGLFDISSLKIAVTDIISFSFTRESLYVITAVGASVSTMISLFSPNEPLPPGVESVKSSALPALS